MMERRRPRVESKQDAAASRPKKSRKDAFDLAAVNDDMIASDDDDDDDHDLSSRDSSSLDEENEETMDARKVRLAREYLETIEKKQDDDSDSDSSSDGGSSDEDEDEEDKIGAKLRRDRLKRSGLLQQAVADKVASRVERLQEEFSKSDVAAAANTVAASADAQSSWIAAGHVQLCKGHDLTLTCVALQQAADDGGGARCISGSKDHSVILWDVEHGKRISYLCPHWRKAPHSSNNTTEKSNKSSSSFRTAGQVLAVACSDDGRLAAVGARDATVRIFDLRTSNKAPVQTFSGHKGPVTALCFRSQSHELFSASQDRCIRHYNLQEMMYLETLYGHQFGVTDIDCHIAERPVSVGMDRTARAWKLALDSHLIFRGGSKLAWAESVSLIRNDWFVTGHADGQLALWNMEKKRAVTTLQNAHPGRQLHEQHVASSSTSNPNNSILCVRALKESDLVATGSYDGYLRFWKVQTGRTLAERGIDALCRVPLQGYLNDVAIGPQAKFCVVATGQEHRLGRYSSSASSSTTSDALRGAKNRLAIVKLYTGSMNENSTENAMNDADPQKEEEGEDSSSDSESSSDDESSE